MDFKTFLEDEVINEGLIVEKVTKETKSILKPYTKKVCDMLVSNGVNPQSEETSFFKLDDSVVEEMTSSAQIFRLFKRALIDNDLAKVSSDNKLINNGQWFIATANNNDRCVSVLLFNLCEEERKIQVKWTCGVPVSIVDTYSPVVFSKVFNELQKKGKVSIFVVTTTYEEKQKLKNLLATRYDRKQDVENSDPRLLKRRHDADLNNYKIIKQIGKYGEKLSSIVANVIDTLENNEPTEIDYRSIIKDIDLVKQALTNISYYRKSDYDYDWSRNYYLDKLKGIEELNESIPNDVRKIINVCSDRSDLYRDLKRVGIAAENADYTILDEDADKFNKSPKFNWYDYEWGWRRKDKFKEDPARVNIVKRLLRKYDAVLLARDRYYAIITIEDGDLKCTGNGSLFEYKLFTIVGIKGGSLEDVKAEKNARVMRRIEITYTELLELVNDLDDVLNSIDYNRDLFYEDRDEFNKAIKLCDIIERTCKSLIIRN